MKKIFSIIISSFIILSLTAQTIYQEGITREINSNKKPLSGVAIKFENAPSQVSGDDGKFQLAFKNQKIGNLIFLEEVKKSGYELVNRKDFEVTKLSNTNQLGVDVILAAAGYVDAAKKEYYGVSDKALLAGFEKEKKGLRQQLNTAQLNQDEYLSQLQSLQQQYDWQKESLDALAEKFARINFDDVSPIYQEALELFKAGEVDKAITTLENTNPAERTKQIIEEDKRLELAQKDINQQKAKNAIIKKEQITILRALADMYNVKFNPLKAEQQYDDLLRLDSTDLEILSDAADFYREQHRYEKAKNIYPKIIAHPKAEPWQVALAHGQMGVLFATTGNLNKALESYTQCNRSYHTFLKADSLNSFYKSNLAISYEKLGSTHTALGNLDKALKYFEQYNNLEKQLFEAYPNNVSFKNGLAISYEKLGSTHTALGNLDKALKYYEEDLNLTKQLFEAYPNNVSFKNGLAVSYYKLGDFCKNINQIKKSREYFLGAEKLWKELSVDAPQYVQFKRFLNIVRNDLKNLEENPIKIINNQIRTETDTIKLYQLYTALCDTLRIYSKKDNNYQSDFAQALNSRAWYGFFLKKFKAVESDIREGIALGTDNKYLATNLPPALLLQGKYDEALVEYQKYKDRSFGEQDIVTYQDAFLDDLKAFEAAGIIPPERMEDVQRIRDMLNGKEYPKGK